MYIPHHHFQEMLQSPSLLYELIQGPGSKVRSPIAKHQNKISFRGLCNCHIEPVCKKKVEPTHRKGESPCGDTEERDEKMLKVIYKNRPEHACFNWGVKNQLVELFTGCHAIQRCFSLRVAFLVLIFKFVVILVIIEKSALGLDSRGRG